MNEVCFSVEFEFLNYNLFPVRAICLPTSQSFFEKNLTLTEVGMNGYLVDSMPNYTKKVTTIKPTDICKKKFKEVQILFNNIPNNKRNYISALPRR